MHQTLLNSGYSFLNQDNTILGEGSCGKVKLVQNSNNEIFAIKIVKIK